MRFIILLVVCFAANLVFQLNDELLIALLLFFFVCLSLYLIRLMANSAVNERRESAIIPLVKEFALVNCLVKQIDKELLELESLLMAESVAYFLVVDDLVSRLPDYTALALEYSFLINLLKILDVLVQEIDTSAFELHSQLLDSVVQHFEIET